MPKRSAPRRKMIANAGRPGMLRIIGGELRGRRFEYSGDPRTRPMKDRVREAIFNLVGPAIVGKHAIDFFAGTGAIGFEAVSRGAARATLLERHFPTAALIRRNAASLGIAERCEVVAADAFYWTATQLKPGNEPLASFISPPYDFYTSRRDDMLLLIETMIARGPAGSIVVVEADENFDFGRLPQGEHWDIRSYPPAVVGILE